MSNKCNSYTLGRFQYPLPTDRPVRRTGIEITSVTDYEPVHVYARKRVTRILYSVKNVDLRDRGVWPEVVSDMVATIEECMVKTPKNEPRTSIFPFLFEMYCEMEHENGTTLHLVPSMKIFEDQFLLVKDMGELRDRLEKYTSAYSTNPYKDGLWKIHFNIYTSELFTDPSASVVEIGSGKSL